MAAAFVAPLALPAQQPTIRADVEAVIVNVLVTDRNGRPMAGLERDDFRIYEDKVEQEITSFFAVDAPFSVALLLDTSFSTYGKLAPIQNSAIQFIEQIHPDDEVMVLSFDDDVYLETDFTRNKEEAKRAVKMTRTGQSTRLHDAIFLGLREIGRQPNRKVMVVFSDGIDTTSSQSHRGETIKIAREAETTVYSIHFDTRYQMNAPQPPPLGTPPTIPGRGPGPLGTPGPFPGGSPNPGQTQADYERGRSYLRQLAQVSGGAMLEARSDLSNLSAVFAQIAEEMRSLYSVSYVSSNTKQDGKFRKIKVHVDVPDARVRARNGYRALKRAGPTVD